MQLLTRVPFCHGAHFVPKQQTFHPRLRLCHSMSLAKGAGRQAADGLQSLHSPARSLAGSFDRAISSWLQSMQKAARWPNLHVCPGPQRSTLQLWLGFAQPHVGLLQDIMLEHYELAELEQGLQQDIKLQLCNLHWCCPRRRYFAVSIKASYILLMILLFDLCRR